MNVTDVLAALNLATPETQAAALRDALDHGYRCGWFSQRDMRRAKKMLAAEAYESAALFLIPAEWRVFLLSEWDSETLRRRGPWECILGRAGEGDNFGGKARCDHASTPGIAVSIAAIAAHEAVR
jgi:hypothetical protein